MINQLTQQPLSKDEVASLTLIATRLVNQAKIVAVIEEDLKKQQEILRVLEMETLPHAMTEVGVAGLTLEGGVKIEVENFYSCSVSDNDPENKEKALKWLRTNGHGELIKHEVKVALGTDAVKLLNSLRGWLNARRMKFKDSQSVNAQTLKSFMKEQLEKGNPFPMDIFRGYSGKKAVVKK